MFWPIDTQTDCSSAEQIFHRQCWHIFKILFFESSHNMGPFASLVAEERVPEFF